MLFYVKIVFFNKVKCILDEFKCGNIFECIFKSKICDYIRDCLYGEDELLSCCKLLVVRIEVV